MELNDVKDLIAFDSETMARVNAVYEKKATVLKEIAEEKESIKNSTWAQVEEKVKSRKSELDQKIAQDIKVNDAYYETMAKKLQDKYAESKGAWEKELFDRCIK